MSTEGKIKHTPLDLDKLERRVKRFGGAGGATVFALLAELRRNRCLLEAGELLRDACKRAVDDPDIEWPQMRDLLIAALAAYQEAAKPE